MCLVPKKTTQREIYRVKQKRQNERNRDVFVRAAVILERCKFRTCGMIRQTNQFNTRGIFPHK